MVRDALDHHWYIRHQVFQEEAIICQIFCVDTFDFTNRTILNEQRETEKRGKYVRIVLT
jgi:hypothetical protein